MIRPILFFVLAIAAVAIAACGNQVTPDPPNAGPGGLSPGYMSLKFDVLGPMNFQTYRYLFAFNTTGNGQTPLTNTLATNWSAYTFSVQAGGTNVGTNAEAFQFLHSVCCKSQQPAYLPLLTVPSQFQYVPNSNGTGTEFTVVFQPLIFSGVATPAPGTTAPPVAPIWLFNAFVAQPDESANLQFVDWLGTTGTIFQSPQLDIRKPFDQVIFGLSAPPPSDAAAQIVSVEIANNPAATPAP